MNGFQGGGISNECSDRPRLSRTFIVAPRKMQHTLKKNGMGQRDGERRRERRTQKGLLSTCRSNGSLNYLKHDGGVCKRRRFFTPELHTRYRLINAHCRCVIRYMCISRNYTQFVIFECSRKRIRTILINFEYFMRCKFRDIINGRIKICDWFDSMIKFDEILFFIYFDEINISNEDSKDFCTKLNISSTMKERERITFILFIAMVN